MGKFLVGSCAKEYSGEGDHLRAAWNCGKCVFAGAHCEEKGTNNEVSRVGIGRQAGMFDYVGKLEELAQELGSYCSLSTRRWVDGVEALEGCADRGKDPGAVFDVKGTLFEIVPKRRSQMACGILDSV
jgi:hypothetical protein